jgi:DNA adenine methylase
MNGPFSYIGGKRALASKIIAVFPAHDAYIEPFAGGAQVLFHKSPSRVEVINDLDSEISGCFRVIQQHYEELVRYMRFMLVSRKWFELLQATDPATLTDIQRAARHLFLSKTCYAGLVRRRNYSIRLDEPPGFNPERIPSLIEETHHRLARVQIECLPYEQVLTRFDRSSSLFYCDPPYFARKLYRYNLEPEEFAKMAEHLGRLKGKFVLSLNDVPDVRTIFKGFRIKSIETPYTAQKVAGRRFRELLITNY